MRLPIAIALVVVGCSSPQPPTPDGDPTMPPLPLQDPNVDGPWLAGVHTVELHDASRNRTFSVDVWYPAEPDGSPNRYDPESMFGTLASIDTPARRDATPAAGTWPLIIFSHGFGGIRFQSYFITERLATHGFVVVSPDHPGNTL